MRKKILMTMLTFSIIGMTGCTTQLKDRVEVEAGQEIIIDVATLFDASKKMVEECEIDTSKVDNTKVGEYDATVKINRKKYKLTVEVVDTKEPTVELNNRYIFTNDIATCDANKLIKNISDYSNTKVELTNFVKYDNVKFLDENELKMLTDTIIEVGNEEELKTMGNKEIPTDEGIYRSALMVTDAYDNVSVHEVFIILDKTSAVIEEMEDFKVEVEDATQMPVIDTNDIVVKDIVDGTINKEKLDVNYVLTDKEKSQYTATISYMDRAGNGSKYEVLVDVISKGGVVPTPTETTSPTAKPKSTPKPTKAPSETKKPIGSQNPTVTQKPSATQKPTAIPNTSNTPKPTAKPTNKPTNSTEEQINKGREMMEQAGNWKIVELNTGNYGVLVPKISPQNTRKAREMFIEYFDKRNIDIDLSAMTGGNWGDGSGRGYYEFNKRGIYPR